MNDNKSQFVAGRMIDGVLYVEAADYQETQSKYEALNAKYDELREKYKTLEAENIALRISDED